MGAKTAGLAVVGAMLGLTMLSSQAYAQVLSIGDDGAVTTYSGPMVFTQEGATAIAPPEPIPSFAAPPEEVIRLIRESSVRHAVPTAVVEAVAWQESRFNHAAVSRKGAQGVMQLSPKTATDLGVDPRDLKSNIDGGVAYLAIQREDHYVRPVWPPEPGKQQMSMHLDFEVSDLDAAVAHALELGAELPDFQPQDNVRVMLDPAGHPFCLYT